MSKVEGIQRGSLVAQGIFSFHILFADFVPVIAYILPIKLFKSKRMSQACLSLHLLFSRMYKGN
jgi:hypothetical protein